jgi:hypothetical protein
MVEAFWGCFGSDDCPLPKKLGMRGCEALGVLGVDLCSGMDRDTPGNGGQPICPVPSRAAFDMADAFGVPDSMARDVMWAIADGYVHPRHLPAPGTSREAVVEEFGALLRVAERQMYPGQQD